jgi:hypothetical protein
MDQRQARRLVTQRVAAAVRALTDFDEFGPADRRRLATARDALAVELEVRAGLTARAERVHNDPDQYALITIDRETYDHETAG